MFEGMHIERINSVLNYSNRFIVKSDHDYTSNSMYCELIYKIKGVSNITFGGESFSEGGNAIRFLPVRDTSMPYKVHVVEPSDYAYFTFLASGEPKKMLRMTPQNSTRIKKLFLDAARRWTMRQEGYYHECMSILYRILAELEQQRYVQQDKADMLAPALAYIEQHLTGEIDCSSLHELCGVSYTYFKQIFIKKYGVPPKKYITDLKMRIACEQLTAGVLSVSEIAELLGYGSVQYFSRVFRDEMGCTAMSYRHGTRSCNETC